jgi:hypothetical protein
VRADEVLQPHVPVLAAHVDVGPELAVQGERGLEPGRRVVGEGQPDGHRAIGRRPGPVRAPPWHPLIRVGQRRGHLRLARPEQPQAVDRVAAAVHQRAAAQVVVVPDVILVLDGEAGPALDAPHRPELAGQVPQPPDQRVIAVVHGLHDH